LTAPGLNQQQRGKVLEVTAACVQAAREIYARDFAPVEVRFDLSGTAAGMYRVTGPRRCIRYNPWIFARYFEDSLAETVPHEVAHYVVDCLFGLRRVRPHGAEWKGVVQALGASGRASACYDLSGLPLRRQRRFPYRCRCRIHQLSACRHHRVQRGESHYLCRYCHSQMVYAG
jgi:SprT protein